MRISDWSSDVCSSDLRDALTAYFRYQYVPAPRSIWRGISKLPPGHSITIDASDIGTSGADGLQHLPCAYWSMESASSDGVDHCLKGPSDAMLGRRSEEHTSAHQSLVRISYAVLSLKKKQIQMSIELIKHYNK